MRPLVLVTLACLLIVAPTVESHPTDAAPENPLPDGPGVPCYAVDPHHNPPIYEVPCD